MKARQLCRAVVISTLFSWATVSWAAIPPGEDAGVAVQTGPVHFWLTGGAEQWAGDVVYRIGYPVTRASGRTYEGYFPFSELTFPLDASFGTLEAGLNVAGRYGLRLQVKKNITDPRSDLEDRDWLTPEKARLDIYSESSVTDFTATVADIETSYRFHVGDRFFISAGLGYMYQEFEYETALLSQWSPSGLPGFEYTGDGSISLIYDVTCDIPYISLGVEMQAAPFFTLAGRFALAPWMKVEDRDQHLLRSKVNTGDMNGAAAFVTVSGRYEITPRLFLKGGLEYAYLEAEGEMDASFYGIYDHTVAEEFESSQVAFFLRLGYQFGAP